MAALFRDRADAGRQLARRLARYAGRPDVSVLGLPRGGVVLAAVVAEVLGAPLDVFIVRKLGVPGREELAMGAIASGGRRVLNADVIRWMGVPERAIEEVAVREAAEIERRERAYRGGRPELDPRDRILILVDDGIATGATMRAAVAALRDRRAGRIVVAVPVASPEGRALFEAEADEIVCLAAPESFRAVGIWYEDFRQTTDDEVRRLLERAGPAR